MSAREAAVRLAALKAIKDRVDEAYTAARKAALASMDPGDRKSARLDDGTDIGTVSVTKPTAKLKARVCDEKAFLAWVEQTRPDEVVSTVRSSYRARVLKRIEDAGDVVDVETGEIYADGVELGMEEAEPYARCAPQTEAQVAAVAAAFADGRLTPLLRGTPLGELEEAP